MRKNNLKILLLFNLKLTFYFSTACGSINSVTVRQLAKSLSEDTGNVVDFEEMVLSQFQIIHPGTKWCGANNVADNYDDLGSQRETDMCCRDHDYCPDIIEPGDSRHNLTNESFYSRLGCKCDEQFRRCLRKANTRTANNIGIVYFNALATKCFRQDYPVVKCVRRGGWLNRKCLEYTYDTSGNMIYQWFDVNNY